MTERERKILEEIKESQAGTEIPESLKPENIEKMLKMRNRKPWWKEKKLYGVAAAAALALVVGMKLSGNDVSAGLILNTEFTVAKDYEDVKACLDNYNRMQEKQSQGFSLGKELIMEESADMGMADMGVDTASAGKGAAFSDTNIRTEGIGEADSVKTDGNYLYVETEGSMEVAILDASKDKLEIAGTVQSQDNTQISEFYVKDKKLVLFTSVWEEDLDEKGDGILSGAKARVEVYDISDVKNPKQISVTEQSGNYQTSRIVGDYIYTFSNYDVRGDVGEEIEDYIPLVNGKALAEDAIYLPAVPAACQYVVVTSLNLNEPEKIIDQKAVLTEYGECYMSNGNIYIYEASSRVSLLREEDQPDNSQTVIRKISYKDGKLEGVAQGTVDGWINDSFSIDEYDGNLRIVTTIDGMQGLTTNAVFVLNEKLEKVGEITGIAKDERVYSARFFGETGYFVTFRETDPLFSVDFSDPSNPKIIGQLKIPGFSEYLHFYGEGKLLGIGMDVDAETSVTNGVKLSMFDISNPAAVKETYTYTLEERYGTEAFQDYKAVLVDTEKNMIGFSAYNIDEKYYIFSYDEETGFEKEMEETVNGGSYMSTRGLYIGERFFVVKGNAIESYRMGSYEKIDDILL